MEEKNNIPEKEQKLEKRIRIVAGIFLAVAVVGIISFNIHYKEKEVTATTSEVTQTETEKETKAKREKETKAKTKEQALSKEDVLKHYKNLAIVGENVDKYLNIREKPASDARIIGKYEPYCYVNIVKKEKDGWYEVELEGKKGYVSDQYIVTGDKAKKLAIEKAIHKVKVSKKGVKGYDANKKDAKELIELVSGDSYDVVKEQKDGWILIRARHNTECFVKAEEVEDGYYLKEGILFIGEGKISDARLDFLNNAWQYLGGEYVWGGEELGVGVDCSGYIWKLLQQYGIFIHRNSIDQSKDGKEVKEQEMRPGDLIFYINRGDQISHVAIYTGSKTILHAASEEKGICLDAWDYLEPQAIRNVFGD